MYVKKYSRCNISQYLVELRYADNEVLVVLAYNIFAQVRFYRFYATLWLIVDDTPY